MKQLILVFIIAIASSACSKQNQHFKAKSVTLNGHEILNYPHELLRLRFLDGLDSTKVLGSTTGYPADLPLPAVLAINPGFTIQLYKDPCYVQLWGDSSGLIGTAKVNMNHYKIIFPLEMEIKSAGFDVTLAGVWDQR